MHVRQGGVLTVCWLARAVTCFTAPVPSFWSRAFSRPKAQVHTVVQMSKPEEIHFYPIGTPGVAWGEQERVAWRKLVEQEPKRSYRAEVLDKVDALRESGNFEVSRYGALSCNSERYPLVVVKNGAWDPAKPTILVTGGVHGYETSGVQGSLLFLQTRAAVYLTHFNMVVAPCVSPWGYEHIQVCGYCACMLLRVLCVCVCAMQ